MYEHLKFLDGSYQCSIFGTETELADFLVLVKDNFVGAYYVSQIEGELNGTAMVYVKMRDDRDLLFLKLACDL